MTSDASTPPFAPGRDAAVVPRLLALLAEGRTDAAIARAMHVSERTVRRYVAQVLQQVGAVSRFQAGVLLADVLAAPSARGADVIPCPVPASTEAVPPVVPIATLRATRSRRYAQEDGGSAAGPQPLAGDAKENP